jgi:methylated-DNA-protein-cysteine methyltransferase related protein
MSLVQISEFTKKVMQEIKKIPVGKVATYKQIAELAGKPQGSRGVAWVLHSCSTLYKLPWHRVLNSQGKISFELTSHNFRQQKKRLEAEGVILTPNGELSLKTFQWKKRAAKKKSARGKPKIFSGKS